MSDPQSSDPQNWRGRIGMKRLQFGVVVVCMFLNVTDGYDIFVMGFAMPHLPEGFVSDTGKGFLISAALAGMGVGAMVFARLADTIGRRLVLIGALVVNIGGLVVSALAPNFAVLLTARFVTGLAIGTIAVVGVVLAQEVCPPARRNFTVGIVLFGFPLGSVMAGTSGAFLLAASGGSWRGLFWIAVILSVVALVATYFVVPESVAFLQKKGTAEALQAARSLAERLDLDLSAENNGTTEPTTETRVYLLGRELRSRTLLLWTGYSLLVAVYYFVGSWTPQLIANASGDVSSGAFAGLMISIGTLVGALLFSIVGLRYAALRIAWVTGAVAATALVAFSLTVQGAFALTMAGLLGLSTFLGVSALTSAATAIYPVLARAKGYGTMLGVARVGTIVAPIVAGLALSVVSPDIIYVALVVPLALSVLAVLGQSQPHSSAAREC